MSDSRYFTVLDLAQAELERLTEVRARLNGSGVRYEVDREAALRRLVDGASSGILLLHEQRQGVEFSLGTPLPKAEDL